MEEEVRLRGRVGLLWAWRMSRRRTADVYGEGTSGRGPAWGMAGTTRSTTWVHHSTL